MKSKKIKGRKVDEKTLKKAIAGFFIKHPGKGFGPRQVIKKIKVANNKSDIVNVLQRLTKEGLLKSLGEGRYGLASSQRGRSGSNPIKTHIGKVDMTRSGAAFIICPDLKNDVFVPAKNMKGANDGDEVKIEVMTSRGGRRPQGRVIQVVKRGQHIYSGVFRSFRRHNLVYVTQGKSVLDIMAEIPEGMKVEDYDRVIIDVTEWPTRAGQNPKGTIQQVLGKAGSNEAEMKGILVDKGFTLNFPEPVLEEAKRIFENAKIEAQEGRLDMRNVPTFTIDPDDAKDFDDALSYRVLEDGRVEVGIHIADVSEYVKPGSELDKMAAERGNSVYLVDRVLPMLPESLSNGLCSLRPREDKYCFSTLVYFNDKGEITGHSFSKTIIRSDQRFTYADAQAILDGEKGPMQKEVLAINDLALKLREERFKKGSIGFETDEVKIRLDEEGHAVEIYLKARGEANLLIEDFMLLANRLVATYISKKVEGVPIPFPYRIHDQPDPAKLHDFVLLAAEAGVNFDMQSERLIAESFNKLMDLAREDPHYKPLVPLAIRSMAKAEYNTQNIGHFGLGFDYYGHFTSPIRRYADLIVHRVLFDNLDEVKRMDKSKLDMVCAHISQQERKAMEAERDSVKMKQAEFLADREGEAFIGVVTSIIDRGFFVTLKDNFCEGMVQFESLDESFVINPLYSSMEGRQSARKIKLGDEVEVIVVHADIWSRQIELTLAD